MTLPDPRAGRVLVLWARPAAEPHVLAVLDEEERARYARLHRRADRERFAAAHALARIGVARLVGRCPGQVRFSRRCLHCGGAHGQPRPDPPELALSLSHSGDRVAVALAAEGAVGVDVERVAALPDAELLARQALAPRQRRAVLAAPEPRRSELVLTCWVRKEAALKATGYGLAADLGDLDVSPATEPARVVRWTGASAPHGRVHLRDLQAAPGYVAALAVLGPAAPVVTERTADDLLGG